MDEGNRRPSYCAYTVIKRAGKEDRWMEVGVAFVHRDGCGFDLGFDVLPLDGKVTLRKYFARHEAA